MLRAFAAILLITFLLSACTQRMICPAYQSAFIYDKDALRKRFSYFQEDSTPKIYTASKTKYLVAEQTSYRKKIRMMQTVPMKPIKTVVPDSFNIEKEGLLGEEGEDGVAVGDELDRAARSVIDSTFIVDVPQNEPTAEDSIYVISRDKEVRVLKYDFPDSLFYDENTGRYVAEKPRYAVVHVTFNVDQDNYMWYLKDYLVLPDVRQARILQKAKSEDEKADKKKSKREKGFFRNLFKKKKKEEPVDEQPAPKATDEEEFDFIDDEDTQQKPVTQQEETKKKKGLFGRKKEKKSDDASEEEEDKPAKKKKEEAKPPVQDPDEKKIPEQLDEDGF